jgi:mannose-1-phosphate guanylyltransferase
MLHYWIDQLSAQGFEAVVVNAYHLSEQLVSAIRSRPWPIRVEVSLERNLLGTGGGIRYALDFFGDEPFVVVNGDILCDADLRAFHEDCARSESRVSLMLHDWPEFNNVAVESSRGVMGFGSDAKHLAARSSDTRLRAFTGIHCLRPDAVKSLARGKAADILDVYRELIAAGQPPRPFFPEALTWREMGSLASYAALHAELASLPAGVHPPLKTGTPVSIDPSADVSTTVSFKGYVVIGKNCVVGEGALLEDVILWDDVKVARGASLRRCVVADRARVSGLHHDEVLIQETAA